MFATSQKQAATVPPGLVTRAISSDARVRVAQETDDQAGQRRVELPVVERQLLGHADPHVDSGVPLPARLDERRRRVDGRHRGRPHPAGQLTRQPARSAADVQHPQARR